MRMVGHPMKVWITGGNRDPRKSAIIIPDIRQRASPFVDLDMRIGKAEGARAEMINCGEIHPGSLHGTEESTFVYAVRMLVQKDIRLRWTWI